MKTTPLVPDRLYVVVEVQGGAGWGFHDSNAVGVGAAMQALKVGAGAGAKERFGWRGEAGIGVGT